MKILVLMPIDEQHVYAAMGIYKALPQKIKEITFAMPMYADYLIQNHICENWVMGFGDAMYSANKIYESTNAKEDLIIIGNVPNRYEFDAVFNFQEIDEALPYFDPFYEKVLRPHLDDAVLGPLMDNLHTADESKLALQNCLATADFLTAYLTSGSIKDKLAKLKAEYEDKLGKYAKMKDVVNLDELSNIK